MQITISTHSGNHENQYPDCDYWKYCSVLMSLSFSDENAENNGVSKGAIQKVIRCVRESNRLTLELREHLLKTITCREVRTLRCIMKRRCFLSASRIRVELIRRTGCHVFDPMFQGRLVHVITPGYRSRYPDRCPRLTLDHRCHHHKDACSSSDRLSWTRDMTF